MHVRILGLVLKKNKYIFKKKKHNLKPLHTNVQVCKIIELKQNFSQMKPKNVSYLNI